ncbi:hypothetical protein [Streptomyces sannanensis]|uniref:hypothetical protein n=1 Tax=Streptomyces sannanensis TaxID=285536 RepID=UPI0031E8A403
MSDQQYPYDPYATQAWQSETWDTQYQPQAHPGHAPADGTAYGRPPYAAMPETAYLPPVPADPQAAAAETAYLPPVPQAADESAYFPPVPQAGGELYAPGPHSVGAETAYFPPIPQAAAETAYFPPIPQAAAETAYFPPVPQAGGELYAPGPHSVAAETAYFPPVPQVRAEAAYASGHAAAAGGTAGPQGVAEADNTSGDTSGDAAQAVAAAHAVHEGFAGTDARTAPLPPEAKVNEAVTVDAPMTYAQRARAEGRSPIIPPGMQPAVLTAVLAALLAGTAALGTYALAVPLVLLQAVTAAGWFRLNGMWPARQGIALAFAGGLTADVALLAAGREHAPAAILGTLGVWVLLSLVLQLRSHASPDERMYGLMATVASAALAVVAAGYLAAEPDAVTVGALAVGVAALARAVPLPGVASVAVALLAAAGAGAGAGALSGMGTQGALLGLGAGVCALIGLRVASYDYPSRFVHFTAGVALPLTVAVPAVYLIGRVVS